MQAQAQLSALRNCGEVRLQYFDDGMDGFLTIAEEDKSIPFSIKRVYYISRLHNPDAIRGKHAHKELQQAIFSISGSFTLDLDDGFTRTSVLLNKPDQGIYLGPRLWHVMHGFSHDCVILVLASALYDESDYLRNYDEFLASIA
jgi:hypothetical protein